MQLFIPMPSEQSESESERPAKRPKTTRTRKSSAATPARKRGASKAKQGAGDEDDAGTEQSESEKTPATARKRVTKRAAKRATVVVRPDASDNEQAALLSRFLTAIGELQMLGFMCPPQGARRKEILLKMPLGGRTA
jgi:hypothetical protein